MARRWMLFPELSSIYCSSQIVISRLGSYTVTWSQQKPPAAEGKLVNGSIYANVAPASVEMPAYQFAVHKIVLPLMATLGSSTCDLKLPGGTDASEVKRKKAGSVGALGNV